MICPSCNHNNVPGADQCANCQLDLAALDRPVALDRVQRTLMEDRIRALLPRVPRTLPPTATVNDAIALLLDENIGAVLIVEEPGVLVGILSERDLLEKATGVEGFASQPVTAYMTARVETVRDSDTLAFALHKMDSGGYRHLPVLRDGKLAGIISVRDLLRHITGLCKASKPAL